MPELEVTQSGGGPWSFVAVQPGRQRGRGHAVEVPAVGRLRDDARSGLGIEHLGRRRRGPVDAPTGGNERVSDRRPSNPRAGDVQRRAPRPNRRRRPWSLRGRPRRSLASEDPEPPTRDRTAGGVRRARQAGPRRPGVLRTCRSSRRDRRSHRPASRPPATTEIAVDDTRRRAADCVRERRTRGERVVGRVVRPHGRPLGARRGGRVVTAGQVHVPGRAVVTGGHRRARGRHVRGGAPRVRHDVEDPGGVAENARVLTPATEDVDAVPRPGSGRPMPSARQRASAGGYVSHRSLTGLYR